MNLVKSNAQGFKLTDFHKQVLKDGGSVFYGMTTPEGIRMSFDLSKEEKEEDD